MPWFEQAQLAQWAAAGRIALASYLVGCLTTGYYLVRYRTGQDIRTLGSGSAGARNVWRLLGWPGFILTLACDCAKGALVVWATQHLNPQELLTTLALIFVVIGHVWPVQLRFQGGKGIATSLGALCLYDTFLAMAFALIFAGAFLLLRRTLVPALVGFACLPVLAVFQTTSGPGNNSVKAGGLLLLAGLVWIAHRKNIVTEISRVLESQRLRSPHTPPRL
jgi:acyl phosphate:glycerol-3-phosphate acyltransferase